MRLGLKLLATGAALALTTQANAQSVTGQISVNGSATPVGSTNMGSATGIDFVSAGSPSGTISPGTAGTLSFFGSGTGSFASLGSCFSANCGTIQDILNFASFPSAGINSFLTLNTGVGGPAVSFDLSSLGTITRNGDQLGLTGSGFFNFTGLQRTAGIFSLTAQGNNVTSFSASVAAVPEPATWAMMLMGFGMVGAAMRYRRRTTKVAFA